MRQYRAVVAVCSLLLALSACGGNDATQAASQTSVLPTATPSPTPTAKPTVDPTTAAKARILADYAYFYAFYIKGALHGGVSYPYEQVMTGGALSAFKSFIAATKGLRGARFTGSAPFLGSEVTALDLRAKPATATVVACVIDNVTGTDKAGKRIFSPPGKVSRVDKVQLIKGRWMVFSTDVKSESVGCQQ